MNAGGHSIARRSVYSIVAALAAFLGFLGSASAQGLTDQRPLWQIDGHKFGLPESNISRESAKISVSRGSFSFQNNDTLVISWVTPAEPLPHLPKRKKYSPLPAVPAHLHALFLDAKTGARLNEHEFPVPSFPAGLFISHSGKLLLRAGDSVRLYAWDFTLLKEVKFPYPIDLQSLNSAWDWGISPDGHRIALYSAKDLSSEIDVYDADELRLLDSWSLGKQEWPPRLGNDFVLTTRGQSRRIFIKRTGRAPEPLELSVMGPQKSGLVWPVNDNAITVMTGGQMAILNIDGKLLFTDTPPQQHFFSSLAATARDCGRFAAEIGRMRGLTIPGFDMYAFQSADQLRVYSLEKQGSIFAVKVKGTSPWIPKTVLNSFSLSPDGSLLAILTNDSVRIYKLP